MSELEDVPVIARAFASQAFNSTTVLPFMVSSITGSSFSSKLPVPSSPLIFPLPIAKTDISKKFCRRWQRSRKYDGPNVRRQCELEDVPKPRVVVRLEGDGEKRDLSRTSAEHEMPGTGQQPRMSFCSLPAPRSSANFPEVAGAAFGNYVQIGLTGPKYR